jgi:hypothetical protein
MKSKLLVTVLMLASIVGLSAETQTKNFHTEVSSGYESTYTYRGVEKADNVAWGSINVSYESFYGGVIGYWDVESDVKLDSEVDFYVGYISPKFLEASLDVGVVAYTYPNAETGFGETDYSFEPYIGLLFDNMIFSPAVYVMYDIQHESLTVEGSLREKFVSQGHIPYLGNLYVTPSVNVGYTDINDITPRGVNTSDAYYYVESVIDFSVKIKNLAVSAGPRYTYTENAIVDLGELNWAAKVSYNF